MTHTRGQRAFNDPYKRTLNWLYPVLENGENNSNCLQLQSRCKDCFVHFYCLMAALTHQAANSLQTGLFQ